jgi:hypothetical protein
MTYIKDPTVVMIVKIASRKTTIFGLLAAKEDSTKCGSDPIRSNHNHIHKDPKQTKQAKDSDDDQKICRWNKEFEKGRQNRHKVDDPKKTGRISCPSPGTKDAQNILGGERADENPFEDVHIMAIRFSNRFHTVYHHQQAARDDEHDQPNIKCFSQLCVGFKNDRIELTTPIRRFLFSHF